MTLRDIHIRAKMGDETVKLMLLEQYKAMLIIGSVFKGQFDENLYQEQYRIGIINNR